MCSRHEHSINMHFSLDDADEVGNLTPSHYSNPTLAEFAFISTRERWHNNITHQFLINQLDNSNQLNDQCPTN